MAFVFADTPEGGDPLSAVQLNLKKLAKMMPDFLLSLVCWGLRMLYSSRETFCKSLFIR